MSSVYRMWVRGAGLVREKFNLQNRLLLSYRHSRDCSDPIRPAAHICHQKCILAKTTSYNTSALTEIQ